MDENELNKQMGKRAGEIVFIAGLSLMFKNGDIPTDDINLFLDTHKAYCHSIHLMPHQERTLLMADIYKNFIQSPDENLGSSDPDPEDSKA